MSHDKGTQKLVRMANQIAAFFATQGGADGAAAVAEHINRFWEPRMRRQLLALVAAGGTGLSPLALAAAPAIRLPDPEDHRA
ncbi:formate dehydrogenase subunit delta [Pelagibacterium lacus]|uniref:Formate dehydrogenase n=1 Tax=Pelagibacterium lacus TaxID=2282655 RepID=A0A369W3A4_9HYPH|nr:formate dehydrogenase subunit delta [Pelagibacterium lacus]RDE08355.1 formate dehydrogenase [Pelagibacterium lacus]